MLERRFRLVQSCRLPMEEEGTEMGASYGVGEVWRRDKGSFSSSEFLACVA